MKKWFSVVLICVSVFAAGCETVKFPLRNSGYTLDSSPVKKNAVLLPFEAELYFNAMAINNNKTIADEKAKAARVFFYNAFKNNLPSYGYNLIGYISLDEFDQPKANENEKLIITNEIMGEYNLAFYNIQADILKTKGKHFDFSVGVRVEELNSFFTPSPDVYVLIRPSGFVSNLGAFEQNTFNTVQAILTLGLSALSPTPDDNLSADIVLIDAKTGKILWLNVGNLYGSSLLKSEDVNNLVKLILKDLK